MRADDTAAGFEIMSDARGGFGSQIVIGRGRMPGEQISQQEQAVLRSIVSQCAVQQLFLYD